MVDAVYCLLTQLSLVDLFMGTSPECRTNLRVIKSFISEENYKQIIETIMNRIGPNNMNPLVEMKMNLERKELGALMRNLIQYESRKIIEYISIIKENKPPGADTEITELVKAIWKDREVVEELQNINTMDSHFASTLKCIKDTIVAFVPKKNASDCCLQMKKTEYMKLFKPELLDNELSLELFYAIVWHHLVMIKAYLQNPGRSTSSYSENSIRKAIQEEFNNINQFYRQLNGMMSYHGSLRAQNVKSEIGYHIEAIKGLL